MTKHEKLIWEEACKAMRLAISKVFADQIDPGNTKQDNAILKAVSNAALRIEMPSPYERFLLPS